MFRPFSEINKSILDTVNKTLKESDESQKAVKQLLKTKFDDRPLGQLSPDEKKKLFNMVDDMVKAKNEEIKLDEAKMSDADVLKAAKALAANGKDEKTKSFGKGLVSFYGKNKSFTPDQVAGLQNIMKNASFQMAKEDVRIDEKVRLFPKTQAKIMAKGNQQDAQDYNYSMNLDKDSINPEDRESIPAQKKARGRHARAAMRYGRIARGEHPFRKSPNDPKSKWTNEESELDEVLDTRDAKKRASARARQAADNAKQDYLTGKTKDRSKWDRKSRQFMKFKSKLKKKLVDVDEERELNESDYPIYHKSYTSAIDAARAYAKKQGYDFDEDSYFNQVSSGQRKPSSGKTNMMRVQLTKNGQPTKKGMQIQVYGMDNGSYELNTYVESFDIQENSTSMMKKYRDNEDKNLHAKNLEMLAKAFGSPAEKKYASEKAKWETSLTNKDFKVDRSMEKKINSYFNRLTENVRIDEKIRMDHRTWKNTYHVLVNGKKIGKEFKNLSDAEDYAVDLWDMPKYEDAEILVVDANDYDDILWMNEDVQLDEKSVSQSQQKLMGMAYAYKKGEMDDASDAVKKLADSMSLKDLKDFASTKHKDLPMKKEEYMYEAAPKGSNKIDPEMRYAINNLLDRMADFEASSYRKSPNYAKFKDDFEEIINDWEKYLSYSVLGKYIRIDTKHGVEHFIVKDDGGGYKKGDVLRPKSYKGPNLRAGVRGNIFDPNYRLPGMNEETMLDEVAMAGYSHKGNSKPNPANFRSALLNKLKKSRNDKEKKELAAKAVKAGASQKELKDAMNEATVTSMDAKFWLDAYHENEDNNYHSENLELLAMLFGSTSEKKYAKEKVAHQNSLSYDSFPVNRSMESKINRYYYRLVKLAGMNEERSLKRKMSSMK